MMQELICQYPTSQTCKFRTSFCGCVFDTSQKKMFFIMHSESLYAYHCCNCCLAPRTKACVCFSNLFFVVHAESLTRVLCGRNLQLFAGEAMYIIKVLSQKQFRIWTPSQIPKRAPHSSSVLAFLVLQQSFRKFWDDLK